MALIPRAIPSQKLLVKEQVPEFVLTNPQICVKNALAFLQKITLIAVSSITFKRNIFPEDAYLNKQVKGQQIKILRGLDDIPDTRVMIDWMKFAFELVSEQYLQKLILVIQSDDSKEGDQKTLETYIFNYDYDEEKICYQFFNNENSEDMATNSKALKFPTDIAASVCQLLKAVDAITSQLAPLPNDCEFGLIMELHEDTPDDAFQQSKLFKAINSYDISFPSEVTKWKLGKIPTKFTTFTVSSKSIFLELDKDKQTKEDEDYVEASQPELQHTTSDLLLINESHPRENNSEEIDNGGSVTLSDNLSLRLSPCSMQEKVINCICECDDDKFHDSIRCASCSRYQHKSCYNLAASHQEQDTHICIYCHNPNRGKICSAPELMNNNNGKAEALYRRALMLCLNETHISTNKIMTQLKVSRQKAQTIFNKLNFDGCFFFKSGRFGKMVDIDHVKKNVFHRYFAAPTTSISEKMEVDNDAVVINPKKRHLNEDGENTFEVISPIPQKKRQKFLETVGSHQLSQSF